MTNLKFKNPISKIVIKLQKYFEYRQFKNLYQSYRQEVISSQVRYDRFVSRYISQHQMIAVSINSAGYPNKYESDRKNLNFEKISELLFNRRDLVELYFSKNQFEFSDFENLMRDIDTTYPTADIESDLVRKLEKVKERIALCLSQKNGFKKHEGERIFGFILRERHFPMFDGESREDAFKRFMRNEDLTVVKSNYFGNPYYDRIGSSKTISSTTNETLKNINSFFKGIDLKVTVFENDNKTP